MFETAVSEDVLQLKRPGIRCLSSGWGGGFEECDSVYNVTVPEGFDRTDLDAYLDERRDRAGFEAPGPGLLTGVSMDHARGARIDPVVAYATVGLSNPAALPVDAPRTDGGCPPRPGTVNVVVGTTRDLDDAPLANLLTVAVEAKAATLLSVAGVPGTTSDAAVAVSDGDGTAAQFTGSATAVGTAARACVRDAVRASFESRYDGDKDPPSSVAAAEYGVVTDRRATVFEP